MQIRLDETYNAEHAKQNTQLPVSSANTAGLKEGDVIMASVERIEGDALLLRVSGGALLRAALQSESLFGLGDAIEANVSRSGDSFMLTVINVTHPIAPTMPEIAARTVQPQALPEMLAVMSRNPGMDAMMARFLANRGIPDTTENLAALTQLSRGGSVGSLLGRILDVISQPDSSLLPQGDTAEEALSQQYRTPQPFTGDAETQQAEAHAPEGAQPQSGAAAAQQGDTAPRIAQPAAQQSVGTPVNTAPEAAQSVGAPAQPQAAQATAGTPEQPAATQSAPAQQEAPQGTTTASASAQQGEVASPAAQPQAGIYKVEESAEQPQAAVPPAEQAAAQPNAQAAQPEAAVAQPGSLEVLAQPEQAAVQPGTEVQAKKSVRPEMEQTEIPVSGKETAQKEEIKARIGNTIRELLIRPEEQSGEHIKKTVDELPMALKTLKSMLIQSDINNKEIYLKGADQTLRQMDLADKAMKFEHMQLPVVLRDGDYRTAELFVFRQPERRKAEGEAGTTILVALDTQHIGRVEALIKESGGGISLEFRLEQPEIAESLKQKTGAIAQAAEAGGYRLTGIRFAGLEKRTTVLNAGEANPEAGRATYGIDVTI